MRYLIYYLSVIAAMYLFVAYVDWDINWMRDISKWDKGERIGLLGSVILVLFMAWLILFFLEDEGYI